MQSSNQKVVYKEHDMMYTTSKKTLAISLAIALGVALMPQLGYTANSGGVAGTPASGDYTGTANNGNDVKIDTYVSGNVHGGYSTSGDTGNNTVTVSGGTIDQAVYGGNSSGIGKATGNTVSISGGTSTISGSVYGGRISTGAATDNTVTIINGTISGNVYGGDVSTGNATGNKVYISGGNITGYVYVGYSSSGNATDNTVTISDGSMISREVYGGYSRTGAATDNKVTISGGTVTESAYGGYSTSGAAVDNMVTITGGTISEFVYGGYGKQVVSRNTVTISGGTISKGVSGGYSSGNGAVTGNTVNISGDTTQIAEYICGGESTNGIASGNSVNISGGHIKKNVYGGKVDMAANATDNTITVTGGKFDATVELYGGNTNGTSDKLTGNTLNWGHQASITSVKNFANYNFIIPESANPGDTLLTVTDATDLSKSTVKLVGINGSRKWAVGEKVTLIDNGSNTITGVDSKLEGKTTQGIKKYKYEIEKSADSKKLNATITGAGLGDQAKSLSEGRIAGLGSLNSSADLAADKGMASAAAAVAGAKGYDVYGAMGYGNTKQKSGSYADSKGTSMMLGMARELTGDSGTTTLGFFFEGGNSSYDTYNNFADAGEVRANGKNKYFGGGVMARKLNKHNVYYEGSLRVGRLNSDYNSYDLDTKYDIKSTYYGLHLGIGKILKIADNAELDIYGKYLWSHQNSATAMIDGDAFNFDALDSHRLRAGARYTTKTGSNIKSYIGLAYEHELDGKAGAMTAGERVAEPSVKGGTGIAELGIIYKPTDKSNFSMDLGVSGYAGKREGFGGQLKLNWGF